MIVEMLPTQHMRVLKSEPNILVGEITNPGKWFSYAQEGALVVAAASVADMVNFTAAEWPAPSRGRSSDEHGSGGFYFFENFRKAVNTYTNNPSSVRHFEIHDAPLKSLNDVGNDIFYDVTGDFIDIGRVIEGTPENVGNFVMGNPRNLFVNIMVNIACPWHVDKDVINYRSARILRLVDWLEAQHIRTSVTAIEATECGITYVVCKEYHDPIDLNALAVVTHSDFLRRIIFRQNEYSKTWQMGYGTATSTRAWSFVDEVEDSALHLTVDWFDNKENIENAFATFEEKIEEYVSEGMFLDAQ